MSTDIVSPCLLSSVRFPEGTCEAIDLSIARSKTATTDEKNESAALRDLLKFDNVYTIPGAGGFSSGVHYVHKEIATLASIFPTSAPVGRHLIRTQLIPQDKPHLFHERVEAWTDKVLSMATLESFTSKLSKKLSVEGDSRMILDRLDVGTEGYKSLAIKLKDIVEVENDSMEAKAQFLQQLAGFGNDVTKDQLTEELFPSCEGMDKAERVVLLLSTAPSTFPDRESRSLAYETVSAWSGLSLLPEEQ